LVVGVGFIVTVNTTKLSQPKDVVNVSLYTPALVILFPLNTKELPLHIACEILVVGVGFIVTVSTIKLSQPSEVVKVSRYTPALVILFPLNTKELPLQIACEILVVGVGLMVTVKMIKLSHPKDVVNVSLYTPALVILFPLNTKELPLHIACEILVVGVGFIVTVSTIKLSQPKDVVKVSLYTPALIILFPLNTKELPLHIACEILVVGVGFMVTVNTIKLSHPNEVVKVSRYTPALVIVFPLNA
jgi:hypothetical protein